MQMVAAIETVGKGLGIGDAAYCRIEIDASVEDG